MKFEFQRSSSGSPWEAGQHPRSTSGHASSSHVCVPGSALGEGNLIQAQVKITKQNHCLPQALTSLRHIFKHLSRLSLQELVQCLGNIPVFHAWYLWVLLKFIREKEGWFPTVQQLFPCEVGEGKCYLKLFSVFPPAIIEQAATRQKNPLRNGFFPVSK